MVRSSILFFFLLPSSSLFIRAVSELKYAYEIYTCVCVNSHLNSTMNRYKVLWYIDISILFGMHTHQIRFLSDPSAFIGYVFFFISFSILYFSLFFLEIQSSFSSMFCNPRYNIDVDEDDDNDDYCDTVCVCWNSHNTQRFFSIFFSRCVFGWSDRCVKYKVIRLFHTLFFLN